MDTSKDSLQELYRKVEIVTRTRYETARRFETHQKLSQWIITGLSLVLILIPLLQALEFSLKHDEKFQNLVSIFLAVFVLAYSLLLANENYSARAERIHNCATKLSELSRDIYPYLDSNYDYKLYQDFSKRYQVILEKYENHDPIDYEAFKLKTKNWKHYYNNLISYIRAWIIVKIQYYILEFWHYYLVTIGTLLMLFYLVNPLK